MAEVTHNTLEIHSLDVVGSEDDGYEINCSYPTGITLLANMEDDYYYRLLREYYPHLPSKHIAWDDEANAVVFCRKTNKPLLVIAPR